MAWFKVDDSFGTSPKVMTIPRRIRMQCLGLWVTAGTWSAQHLTDGRIPDHMIEEWGAEVSHGDALVASGLWERDTDSYVFHDWSDYQPTRVDTLANREKERRRKEDWRLRNRENTTQSPAGTESRGDNASEHPDPTRPDPTRPLRKDSSSDSADAEPRPEIIHLLDLLDSELERNGSKRPNRTKRNIDAARLLLDRDGRTVEQVEKAIRFAQADEFWRSNILSMSKLREKYDTLRLAAQKAKPGNVTPMKRSIPQNDEWMYR